MVQHCEQSEITQERNAEVIRNLYNTIFNDLDIEITNKILTEHGRACADSFAKRLPPGSLENLDTFLRGASSLGKDRIEDVPSEIQRARTVERKGNTIYWTLHVDGKCICHLLRAGLLEPSPRMGICCSNWVKRQLERFINEPIKVELIASPLISGSKDCRFKCTIAATEEEPVYNSKTGTFVERHRP